MVGIRKTNERLSPTGWSFGLASALLLDTRTCLHLCIPPIFPKNKGEGRKKDKQPSEKYAQHGGKKMRTLWISQNFPSFQGQIKKNLFYYKNKNARNDNVCEKTEKLIYKILAIWTRTFCVSCKWNHDAHVF